MHAPCSHLQASLHALAHMFECARSLQPSVFSLFSMFLIRAAPSPPCVLITTRFIVLTFIFFSIEILHSGLCSSLFPSLCSCYNRGCEANAGLYFLLDIFFLAEPSCVQHFLCSCCAACFCCLSLIPFLKEKAVLIPWRDPQFLCQWL